MVKKFSFKELPLKDAYLIEPLLVDDLRGSVIKDYSLSTFKEAGINHILKEVFYTVSRRGVIRAIHFQEVKHQPKLVRCISGKIYDVIVDLRPNSPTFKKWYGIFLSGDNPQEILVPEHFGHGYLVIEDSIVSYKCSEEYDATYDSGIMYNDEELSILWPFDKIGGIDNIIISEKDKNLQSFNEYFNKGCK